MHELALHVEQNLRRYGLSRLSRVLLAVSGGVDSTVLLDVLTALAPVLGWSLGVAHVEHGLRGKAGVADARRVRALSRRLNWPIYETSVNVAAAARRDGISIEMAARSARHEFLARTAREKGFPAVALAHHADDQVELFFLRLLRGSGVEGLAGMKWSSPSPVDRSVLLIRPLLDLPKSALLAYARERRLPFSEDATNAVPDFLRNRVRNELLPLLRRRYQPGLDQCILRTMEIAAADADYLASQARSWLASRKRGAAAGIAADFDALPLALQRECLRAQLLDLGHSGDFDLVERLRTGPGRRWEISPGTVVLRDPGGSVRIESVESSPEFLSEELLVDLERQPASADFGGLRFQWRFASGRSRAKPRRRAGSEVFDAGLVGTRIKLRHWRPGDRFWPIGGPGNAKLQDLLTNEKVPAAQRRRLVLACTASGEIFWVQGLRISERFKLTDRTRKQLHWRWTPA